MTPLEESTSSRPFRAESEYFRGLQTDKQTVTPKSKWASEKTFATSSVAYDLFDIEIAKRNFEVSYKHLLSHLLKLQSSKAYSLERTSPIVNILSKIWVNWAIGLTWWGMDIDRIHRTSTFDITSSDLVEDFVQIERQISPEILQFCSQNGILQSLPVAIDLIERHFPSNDKLDLYLEHDPETEEEWLVLDLTLRGEVDEVLDNYDKYTDHWVSSVPWPQRHKIRLVYNII